MKALRTIERVLSSGRGQGGGAPFCLKDSSCADSHLMTKFLGILMVYIWYTNGIQIVYN